jgi:hypothetical protein
MAKPTFAPNPRVQQIFEDLEQYLEFCQDHGYRYNEADLYNWKSYAYQQFNKYMTGKSAKDMWLQDARFDSRRPAVARRY